MDCLRAERISSSSSASTSAARPGSCTQRAYQPQRNSRERHYSGVCVVAAVVTEARPQTKTPQAAVLQSFGGFDHLNQQIREGHHEAHLVDKQVGRPERSVSCVAVGRIARGHAARPIFAGDMMSNSIRDNHSCAHLFVKHPACQSYVSHSQKLVTMRQRGHADA